jgi:exodeoxyribonuclease-3
MKIAVFNVNSVRARLDNLLAWLKESAPDVVMLQELKCQEEQFPALEITGLGYEATLLGQKSYNGVAILSKHKMEDVFRGLPGDPADEQARYIEATVKGVRLACLYAPNGNPAGTEKFTYKLAWLERLQARARELISKEIPVVMGGDWNIIPEEIDAHDPDAWRGDALFRPEARQAWRKLLNTGWTDAFRALDSRPGQYTFWDYKGAGFQRGDGIRIDHFLLSPEAADRLTACRIDAAPRALEKASDHTPVILELAH